MRSPAQRRRIPDERPATESRVSAVRHRRRFPRAAPPMSRRTTSQFRGYASICYRVFLEKPFDQRAIDGRIPIRRSAEFLADDSVAANDDSLRISRCVVQFGYGAGLPALIVEYLERKCVPLRELPDQLVGPRVVDADGDDLQSTGGIRLVQLLDARHLHDAWLAPGRPDVDHHDVALVLRQRFDARRRVERRSLEVRCLVAYAKRRKLVAEVTLARHEGGTH